MNGRSKPPARGRSAAVQGTSGSLNARCISRFTRPCPDAAVGSQRVCSKYILMNVIGFILKTNSLRHSGNAALKRGIEENRTQHSGECFQQRSERFTHLGRRTTSRGWRQLDLLLKAFPTEERRDVSKIQDCRHGWFCCICCHGTGNVAGDEAANQSEGFSCSLIG